MNPGGDRDVLDDLMAAEAYLNDDGGVSESGAMPHAPYRVWRRRVKGWRMPENTVSVCRPGRFGNPFLIGQERTQRQAVDCFRHWLTTPWMTCGMPEEKQAILDGLESLRGKNLACYCRPGTPCHADVLLDLANAKD